MNKAIVNTVNTADGGDSVYQGIVNILAELSLIYGHINTLWKLSSGTTPPSGAEVNDVWVDTSGATPVLKRLASTGPDTWANLGATGAYNSGVALDDAVKRYTRGMVLARYSASALRIAATSTIPATVVANGVLLQNTSNTDLTGFSADGVFQVYAERNSTSANFRLGKDTVGAVLSSGKVKIAEVVYQGGDFKVIENIEHFPHFDQAPRGMFVITRDTDQNITEDEATNVNFLTVVNDEWSQYDSTEDTIIIRRTGWWRIGASVRVHVATATHVRCEVRVKTSTGTNLLYNADEIEGAGAIHVNIPDQPLYIEAGTQLEVSVTQTNNLTGSSANGDIEPSASGLRDVALWGEYIGK